MSLLASSSSCNYKYIVFPSFHGPDVRKTLLSHMRKQFDFNGITMFDDQGIERSEEIAPSLKKAIKESRISIVILSKKYASSSWCLDELVDILKRKKAMKQIVMTVFYGVEPFEVRNQTGEFGIAFNETCARKTDEERQKWSKALNEVANIAGEDFLRCDNEAKRIEKIARDVSNKLNATPCRDFDGMVGLEAHLTEMESLLDLDYDGVKMVGISGPAGIGKTTIAKALQSRFSNRFQLTCFVDNLRGSYLSGLDELRLQEQFLSNVLNQDGIRINHSGVIEERLCKLRVLIILDDVDHIKQLEALANKTTWFGPRSRIVVTTENKELLQQEWKSYPQKGFQWLALRVTQLCGKLPLGLCMVGSSLRGKNEEGWEEVICSLENNIDRDIEEVLRVGYESLDDNEKTLFLHIAIFFNNQYVHLVERLFADGDLDFKRALKILENRSLIEISFSSRIVMHRLLQQVGKKAIQKQEPLKRQILMDAREICYVLENDTDTRYVSAILFDISGIDEVYIREGAFRRMSNLRFLTVYKSKDDGNDIMDIPKRMEFPRRLRILKWEAYPNKCFPPKFHPEYLVELVMKNSKLEYLWQGTQPLKNLKEMNLKGSSNLKALPNLSNATKMEILKLSDCKSLVEIPSSFSHLQRLEKLRLRGCISLEVIPADMNLEFLYDLDMRGCSRLRNIPVMSTRLYFLNISETAVEDVSASITSWHHVTHLSINSSAKLRGLTHLPRPVEFLDLSYSGIERIPNCIKDRYLLKSLTISGCRRLTSLPELPASLKFLVADDCESLETVFCPFKTSKCWPFNIFEFTNCFKLDQEARRAIIQRPFFHGTTLLPGREVPAEFDHRGRGNTLTIPLERKRSYRGVGFCVVISPNHQITEKFHSGLLIKSRTKHLLIIHYHFERLDHQSPALSRELFFELRSVNDNFRLLNVVPD
ncbi:Disease resistance protein (TIR-NBS-LRR class) family [Arabidopsis thaliana]|uniref:Disease resistance protein (TIR-NBS-LRR class) family n=2 Tax=Arabidopsis thaliana TaxID=3702 RepID=A0A1P8AQP9_ARATH|nr:Disease resistance protein (TIR-NBS-LRR class) family [Arabidopsis thaliana]NP_001321382.1 Disease resistance protein (TIR-NBS-LRR class) family [Arabidopsis thaliana]NP_001321383.1 Disease resistance protein (TIR-NBS-LRR class) family [Arabidopsis thaliana]ANM58983.1 Disease resistance protein (TIR-NBS-LRR class) family [Arabidopsis thaliana]ANM58984.1 Disease resistance protein (TIR-NBS-LRR class) family [Arabidopsis thaliana]ANM58985.1 Disease resistance protein (TIR-NBS-LRR class) famil|eukprot:NP_001321381.1 Disease resistance protein (TIR-NBS-LRR class) family [Arabidopsis thaliana]